MDPSTRDVESFAASLDAFRSCLDESQSAAFASANFDDLQLDILAIQADQDRHRTMMNLPRLNSFLAGMEGLDSALRCFLSDEIVTTLMAHIWGPTRWFLKVCCAPCCSISRRRVGRPSCLQRRLTRFF